MQVQRLGKTGLHLLCNPASNLLLGYYPREIKTYIHMKVHRTCL